MRSPSNVPHWWLLLLILSITILTEKLRVYSQKVTSQGNWSFSAMKKRGTHWEIMAVFCRIRRKKNGPHIVTWTHQTNWIWRLKTSITLVGHQMFKSNPLSNCSIFTLSVYVSPYLISHFEMERFFFNFKKDIDSGFNWLKIIFEKIFFEFLSIYLMKNNL